MGDDMRRFIAFSHQKIVEKINRAAHFVTYVAHVICAFANA